MQVYLFTGGVDGVKVWRSNGKLLGVVPELFNQMLNNGQKDRSRN